MSQDRFDVTEELAEGVQFLADNGYVVFGGVLSQDEICHAKNLLWKHLENEIDEDSEISRSDPTTWEPSWDWPGDPQTGIIGHFGFGQSEFLWYLRGNKHVRNVFSQIWDTSDLITSFDGGNVFRPWAHNKRLKTHGSWFHVDQNVTKAPDRESVQGLVTLYDATPDTGGLTVLPRSHLQFKEFSERQDVVPQQPDFVMLGYGDPVFTECPAKLVTCKAGDLCLWDSRTVHCNSPGGTYPKNDNNTSTERTGPGVAPPGELLRAVGYVCMTPRSFATPQVLARRQQLFEKGATTSHWPHRNIPMEDERCWDFNQPFKHSPEQLALV
eukprot:TRINITY_DN21765_c0_g1_i1.p1 TRINITY_DN21765_c0_g1~~TRINITY_DN21765_c0_g1_i1.p1  ORF type:complete len:326 (-),score=26.26 TRINITY_DN21765_c0_g1_i1:71-1048(-)